MYAFNDCSAKLIYSEINKITIPESIESLGANCFENVPAKVIKCTDGEIEIEK